MSFFSSLFNSSSGGGSSRAAAATAASGAGAPAIHSELVIDPEHLRSLRIMGTREAAVIVSGTPDGAVVTGMSHAWTTVEVRAPAGAEFPLPEYMEVTVLQTPAREASVCFGITAEDSTITGGADFTTHARTYSIDSHSGALNLKGRAEELAPARGSLPEGTVFGLGFRRLAVGMMQRKQYYLTVNGRVVQAGPILLPEFKVILSLKGLSTSVQIVADEPFAFERDQEGRGMRPLAVSRAAPAVAPPAVAPVPARHRMLAEIARMRAPVEDEHVVASSGTGSRERPRQQTGGTTSGGGARSPPGPVRSTTVAAAERSGSAPASGIASTPACESQDLAFWRRRAEQQDRELAILRAAIRESEDRLHACQGAEIEKLRRNNALLRGDKALLETVGDEELDAALEETRAAFVAISDVHSHRRSCIVCMSKRRVVCFLPCAHTVACADCAERLGSCPMCRGDIRQRVKVLL